MPLDDTLRQLVTPHLGAPDSLSAVVFGLCWPNESVLADRLNIEIEPGETILQASDRLDLPWSPSWLMDAGHAVRDAGGNNLRAGTPATVGGRVAWYPEVRLCRVDDQTRDAGPPAAIRRRLAGEVAIAALWSEAAIKAGIDPAVRPLNLDGNTRGARFKDLLVFVLRQGLPANWRVEPEVYLTNIRGLHMRRNVGGRRSDIVAIDEGNRLVAVISSKWTWRSDRGTEAAQMVPLMRYRPDVPYALVTAEFPRATTVGRDSIEDRAYHVCSLWVGAWLAVNRLTQGSPRGAWPDLASLKAEGLRLAETIGLPGLPELVTDLVNSGTIL